MSREDRLPTKHSVNPLGAIWSGKIGPEARWLQVTNSGQVRKVSNWKVTRDYDAREKNTHRQDQLCNLRAQCTMKMRDPLSQTVKNFKMAAAEHLSASRALPSTSAAAVQGSSPNAHQDSSSSLWTVTPCISIFTYLFIKYNIWVMKDMYFKWKRESQGLEKTCVFFLTLFFKLSKGRVWAIKWQSLELHDECLGGKSQLGRGLI